MRFLVVAAALVGVVVAAGLASLPRSASACTLAPFTIHFIPDLIERTPVIAVGTWTDSAEREVTLVVDEGLKGATEGDEFVVDNRETYLSSLCESYELPFRSGHRFKDGQRSIVFLEKEVDGLWWIGRAGYAAVDVPADDLEPLWWDGGAGLFGTSALDDVIATAAASEIGSADAGMETDLGCQPPHIFDVRRVADYASLATWVALVTVSEAPEWEYGDPHVPVPVAVNETLKGEELPPWISLNDGWISDYYTGDCEPALEDGRRQLVEGQQYLAFLRADEFGVAEYRPVAWGKAIVSVNERWLTHDHSTLGLIRELTAPYRPEPAATEPTKVPAAAPAGETSSPPAGPDSTDTGAGRYAGEGDGGSMMFIIAGVATAVLAAGVVVVARRRWLQWG